MSPEDSFAALVSEGDMVLERLDACVQRTPGKVFIAYGDDRTDLSFAAFKDRTDRIATGLAAAGICKGDRVSVFTRNALVSSLAMFAIWRVGAVFAPINFYYKGKLLSYQVRDTDPAAIITDTASIPLFAEVQAEIGERFFILHHPAPGAHDYDPAAPSSIPGQKSCSLAELEAHDPAPPRLTLLPSDTANIIYTSGTTGPAKGVVQPYRWMNQYGYYPRRFMNTDDVVYNDLPMYHVGGAFFALTRALWLGNTVVLWDRFSPKQFWTRICEGGVTTCILVDVMIPWLMNAAPLPTDKANPLRMAYMQPLPLTHHAVAQRFGIDFVTAGFGQTETGFGFCALIDELPEGCGTPAALYRGLPPDAVRQAADDAGVMRVRGDAALPKGFMGRPVPLLDAGVMAPGDVPCPAGEVGELVFKPRFPDLMLKTYFNKPDANARAFANGWFHTGDAARRCADGTFEFVDRIGGFFRVRGENVSSYQVEDLLNGHDKIRATAAIPIPAAEGDEEDIAVFIELSEGAAMDEAEVRRYAAQVMPKFMQPKHIRILDALPLTPTNKIEKYKLKQSLLAELGG